MRPRERGADLKDAVRQNRGANQQAFRGALTKPRGMCRLLNFRLHIASKCLDERGDDLAPTEGRSDRCENCLHDMRIVGNTQLIWNG
jgi:hypothetical protein